MIGRRPTKIVLGALGLTVLVWGTARFVLDRRFESDLDEARRLVLRGASAEALPLLARLADDRPGRGEAALLLGDAEDALGRPGSALEAWSRVPPWTEESPLAALRRGLRAIDLGRFEVADESLKVAIQAGGRRASEAREALIRLYWREARFAESAGQVEDQWRDLLDTGRLTPEAALGLLRGHLALDLETFPADQVVTGLGQFVGGGTGDDRVELARARWAIRGGRLDEARSRLDALALRRPGDSLVWLARLDWAREAQRPDECLGALAHVPADRVSEKEVASLAAWLAGSWGDSDAERVRVESLLKVAPADLAAIERLADLRSQAGDREAANRLRARHASLVEAKHRYKKAFQDDELASRAGEMAGLAATLGRDFEAWAFSILAQGGASTVLTDRTSKGRSARPSTISVGSDPERTLADLIGAEFRSSGRTPSARTELVAIPRFEDDASKVGLTFSYENGSEASQQLPEVMGGGVGLIDYDGDGFLDVYAIQGGTFPPKWERPPMGDRLFRNRGDGTFEDATARSGLAGFAGGYGHGVAVGDFDGDGHPDLFITRWRGYALYRNRGDGTFADATEGAGLAGDRDWPTSAAFADLDGDGDLDLYVCHYLRWDAERPRLCPNASGTAYQSCDPRHFEALRDHSFRNDGGRFVDVALDGSDHPVGRGLGVVAADLDDDGRIDLFVANDGSANFLLRNLGGFRFEEVGMTSGVACNAEGSFQAGMGVAAGDLDGDGRLDLFVTNFHGEATTYFRNLGGGRFADESRAAGIAGPSRSLLGFGISLLDANNDGRLDLATANGHVIDDRPRFPYAMPAQLLLGAGGGRMVEASKEADPPWQIPRIARGLASGDLDNDGKVDLLLVAHDGPLAFFHNRGEAGHWVTFGLVGTKSNKDGVGARVMVRAGVQTWTTARVGGGSYESASDPRVHLGLGKARRIEEVEVQWPSGLVDRHRDLAVDRGYRLVEGEAKPGALPGYAGGVSRSIRPD